MNTKKRIISMMVASVLMTTALAAVPSTASADTVSVSEVASALHTMNASNGNLVAEPAISSTDAGSAAVAKSDSTTVDIPKDPSKGVNVTANGQRVSISLPNAGDASKATRLFDGTVAYAGANGSANAVVPTDAGVQMFTAIKNASAPSRYTYKVGVPDGGKVAVIKDGRAIVTDARGAVVMTVDVPWAKDANGASVPTHYETDGTLLTQVVDHTDGNYAYPITADPNFSWQWWGVELKFSKRETSTIATGVGAAQAYFGWTGAAGIAAWAATPAARWATSHGYCLDVKFYYYRWPYPAIGYYYC